MRIAILLPDLRGGGAESVRLILAGEFARREHEVEFVLMRARGELLPEAEARHRVVDLGVTGMSKFLWQRARRSLLLDTTAFGRPVRPVPKGED